MLLLPFRSKSVERMPPPQQEIDTGFKPLTAPAGPGFNDLYALYSDTISAREQKSKTELCAMVGRPDYRFLVAQEGTTVVGFSITFVPANESFCLLEYMAIHERCRNRGLGRQLFQETVRSVQKEFIILEADSDREPSADNEIRRRRLNFYRRLGCRRIEGCAYILPLPGEGPPPEMDLLVRAANATPTIPRVKLRRWLEVIYSDVYRCAKDDPRIGRMMASVRDPVELV
jgi:GNAT superfamily N-acetyltransferase